MDELITAYVALDGRGRCDPATAGPILARLLAGESHARQSPLVAYHTSGLLSTLGHDAFHLEPLSWLTQAGQPQLQPETRRKLLSLLLACFASDAVAPLSPSSPVAFLSTVLSLIKFVGRSAAGSEELGREPALQTLLEMGGLRRAASLPQAAWDEDEDELELERDPLLPHESEALRCLCNTLTLHPAARDFFPLVLVRDRAWLEGIVRLLDVEGAGFLAGRLLFLLTSKQGDLIIDLVEQGNLVRTLIDYSTRYLAALRSPSSSRLVAGPMPTAADILQEHFKTAYNIMLQYGRHAAAAETLPLQTVTSPDMCSSPTPPSATTSPVPPSSSQLGRPESSIASVATTESEPRSRPGSPTIGMGNGALQTRSDSSLGKKKRFWESKVDKEKKGHPRSKSPGLFGRRFGSSKSSAPPLPQAGKFTGDASSIDGPSDGTLSLSASQPFRGLFPNLVALAVLLPLGGDAKQPTRMLRHAIETLLNFPITLEELDGFAMSWLQPVPSAEVVYPSLAPLPSRLLHLLTRTCNAYFPTDTDGKGKGPAHPDELITVGVGDSTKAEEILGPIILLLRKLTLLLEPAATLRELILPSDIDRSIPLEQRHDLIGHLLRLLSSILLPNTAHGVGEFLFNLCERDPRLLCTEIGYGNASGYLQNIGQLIPPPQMPDRVARPGPGGTASSNSSPRLSEEASSFSRPVNPITGAYEAPPDLNAVEMTDEEKAIEAEKLYVLFDRMAKTGVMKVENPVDKARSEGRFVETNEEAEAELRRLAAEEERDEIEAAEEMRRWKERSKAPAS